MKTLLFILYSFLFLTNSIIGQDLKNIDADAKKSDSSLKEISVKGITHNRKGGAVVESNSIHYWIEGKDSWDENYLNKKVSVNGLLSIKKDPSVFLDTNEIKVQGIPVYSEEDLEKSKKYWIIKANIKLLD